MNTRNQGRKILVSVTNSAKLETPFPPSVGANYLPFDLRPINLIFFPNWQQEEENLVADLKQVITSVASHSDRAKINLIITTGNILEEEANFLISGVAMELLLEEDLDVTAGPEISLIPELESQQIPLLQLYIHGEISLQSTSKPSGFFANCPLEKLHEFRCSDFFFNLADKLFTRQRWLEAGEEYRKLLNFQVGDAEAYWRLSECYRNVGLKEAAFATLDLGIKLYPREGKLHFTLINNLRTEGRNAEAINRAETASQLLPEEYTFKLLNYLLLPSLYDNPEEITFYRQRFSQGLSQLIQETTLDTALQKQEALAGICRLTNFYLPYQGQNDVELQTSYGNLIHRIMAANYPQWVQPLPMPPVKEKIRIGYISAYLHSYSGTLWLTGWLRYANREELEIYCYYTGNSPDQVTEQFREYSDVFHHIPVSRGEGPFVLICQQVIADNLHILIYPEIGMDAPTMALAALRLAPVQCTAWGHPVTSGLPTIDYFLSSELMEAENAEEHYSEKLVRLPNIGVAYPQPKIPSLEKTRADFDLPEDKIIYLCCQAPFKYLPQYDHIFPAIAQQVPEAKFLFLRGELLKPRLTRAFKAVGLKMEDYCLFRKIPGRGNYLSINLLSDIYLDTISWSGGNTSLEAIACHLPIVTLTGEFMRGRHTDSFLKMIGVTETIATDEEEYVEVAVKLALDVAWRERIVEEIKARKERLYDDRECVAGLERFFRKVCRDNL